MAQPPPPERPQNGSAEAVGSPEKDCLFPEKTPFGKFRSLASKLVNVSRVELIEEVQRANKLKDNN